MIAKFPVVIKASFQVPISSFFLLICRQSLLEAHLKKPDAKAILQSYDYQTDTHLENLLFCLSNRFSSRGFPHEIGLFLGYPPKDVGTFIEKKGKDYLCCHYWKVYHDKQSAIETFQLIDNSKLHAVRLLSQKIPVHTVAKMLTAI